MILLNVTERERRIQSFSHRYCYSLDTNWIRKKHDKTSAYWYCVLKCNKHSCVFRFLVVGVFAFWLADEWAYEIWAFTRYNCITGWCIYTTLQSYTLFSLNCNNNIHIGHEESSIKLLSLDFFCVYIHWLSTKIFGYQVEDKEKQQNNTDYEFTILKKEAESEVKNGSYVLSNADDFELKCHIMSCKQFEHSDCDAISLRASDVFFHLIPKGFIRDKYWEGKVDGLVFIVQL